MPKNSEYITEQIKLVNEHTMITWQGQYTEVECFVRRKGHSRSWFDYYTVIRSTQTNINDRFKISRHINDSYVSLSCIVVILRTYENTYNTYERKKVLTTYVILELMKDKQ